MKKILFVAVSMAVLSMTACGSKVAPMEEANDSDSVLVDSLLTDTLLADTLVEVPTE